MGVTKLWPLLDREDATPRPLTLCGGERWAVDLSAWIVHGSTAVLPQSAGFNDPTLVMLRTVFHRALCLLKHGIRPVFVLDGMIAPEVKSKALNRRCEMAYGHSKRTGHVRFGSQEKNMMCKKLLKSLGLMVITSPGEAEKTCAILNQKGMVDACLTDDSDTFLYGGDTVYRNFDMKKEVVEKHTLSEIEETLGLSRRDLVVMALLSGCDYGDGVKNVGPKKTADLIRTIKQHGAGDVLTRVCGWRDSPELVQREGQSQELSSKSKSSHCRQCRHPGKNSQHKKEGCTLCETSAECIAGSDRPCTCDYHTLERSVVPHKTELSLRKKALADESFPDKQLVSEFLDDSEAETLTLREVTMSLPDPCPLISDLQLTGQKLMRKLIPVLLSMHLHGTLSLLDAKPQRIVRESTKDKVLCFLVQWEQFGFDKWTSSPSQTQSHTSQMTPPPEQAGDQNPYTVHLPRDLLERKYPELVKNYKLEKAGKKGKGKRPAAADEGSRKMTDFFTVKRQLFTSKETD